MWQGRLWNPWPAATEVRCSVTAGSTGTCSLTVLPSKAGSEWQGTPRGSHSADGQPIKCKVMCRLLSPTVRLAG